MFYMHPDFRWKLCYQDQLASLQEFDVFKTKTTMVSKFTIFGDLGRRRRFRVAVFAVVAGGDVGGRMWLAVARVLFSL